MDPMQYGFDQRRAFFSGQGYTDGNGLDVKDEEAQQYGQVFHGRGVVYVGPPLAVQQYDDDAVAPLDQRVNEIATKELRYLAITVIAVATGLIAAQGWIAATVITAAAVIAVYAIQAHAEKTFLDLQDPLGSAAKAQMFAHLHFWSHALMAGTMAGLTGALALSGVLAIAVDNLLLKGFALQLAAWLGLASPTQSAITDVAIFGNNPQPFIDKFGYLHTHLKTSSEQGTLHPSLPAFLLKQYLDKNLTKDSLFRQLNSHMASTGIEASVYFTYLAPILSSDMIAEFVQTHRITWDVLLDVLSEEQIQLYTGPIEALMPIMALMLGSRQRPLDDDERSAPRCSALFADLATLGIYTVRLRDCPKPSVAFEQTDRDRQLLELQEKNTRIADLEREIEDLLTHKLDFIDFKLRRLNRQIPQGREQNIIDIENGDVPKPAQMPADELAKAQEEIADLQSEFDGLPNEANNDRLELLFQRIKFTFGHIQMLSARLQAVQPLPSRDDGALLQSELTYEETHPE